MQRLGGRDSAPVRGVPYEPPVLLSICRAKFESTIGVVVIGGKRAAFSEVNFFFAMQYDDDDDDNSTQMFIRQRRTASLLQPERLGRALGILS
jgi:hypothetical protein